MTAAAIRLSAVPAAPDPEETRLYLHGLPGVAAGERAWVFAAADRPGGWGVKVKRGTLGRARIDAALASTLTTALRQQGALPPTGAVDWAALRALAPAADAPPASPRPALAPAPDAVTGPAWRAAQAAALDVAAIPCAGPLDLALAPDVPDALAARLAAHPLVRLTRDDARAAGEVGLNGRLVVVRLDCTQPPGELSTALLSGRLFPQAQALALADQAGFLLLEGDLYAHHPHLPLLEHLDGFLAYAQAGLRLSILQTYRLNHSAYLLVKLAAQDRYGLAHRPRVHGPRPAQVAVARRDLLTRLPGITAAVADRLLARFGSLAAIATATPDDLLEVAGVGPPTVSALRRVWHDLDVPLDPETP